uniref:Importin subunit beta-1 n=1 Tax=Syphacia muris TaxID=451379 RepID=A0A0N5AS50_9BILA
MLVYDVVQYLGLDVLNDDIEMSILMSIAEVVEKFPLGDSDEIMNGIQQVFNALFHGFQDSLGGVYNLVAVKTLECPTTDVLFQQCF